MKKKINLFLFLIVSSIMYANVNTFKKIEILSKHPAKENLLNTANKYLNKRMDEKSISSLIDELSNKLKDEGYITAKLKLLKGNINSGDLYFEIESGKIGKIYFSDNKIPNRKIKTAFNIKEGSEFNIKDLDQGIENLNIGNKEYKLEIVDSNNENVKDVIIHADKKDYPKFVNLSLDNSPAKLFHSKLEVSTEKYNLLNLNDTLKISANTRLNFNIFRDFDSKINFTYTIPYAYSKYKYALSLGSSINKKVGNTGNDITTKKLNVNQKFEYSRIIFKDKFQQTQFNTSLNIDKNNTWINGVKIDVQSLWDIYSNQSLGYNRKIENGSYGLKINQEIGFTNPYIKYSFDLNYDKFYLLKNNNSLNYSLRGSSTFVYSANGVLEKNKASIGDESTVRGFKKISITGERGAYLNNTLRYRMKNTDFSPFVGFDLGIAKDNTQIEAEKVLGISAGFSKKIRGFDVNATISKGFLISKVNNSSEKIAVYINIGKRF